MFTPVRRRQHRLELKRHRRLQGRSTPTRNASVSTGSAKSQPGCVIRKRGMKSAAAGRGEEMERGSSGGVGGQMPLPCWSCWQGQSCLCVEQTGEENISTLPHKLLCHHCALSPPVLHRRLSSSWFLRQRTSATSSHTRDVQARVLQVRNPARFSREDIKPSRTAEWTGFRHPSSTLGC